ncbi:hypothetical protein JX266_012792 [Neoarthrinium moseri]|nr:hypothetical protein JX266_012792 [Neoarthrinium moseri]
MVVIAIGMTGNGDNPLGAVNIPATGVGSPSTDGPNKNTCPPGTEKKNKDSPLCDNADCKGPHDTRICTVEPYKDCPCLLVGQKIFASIDANHGLLGAAVPSCSIQSHGNDFDGKPQATPASWCVCDSDGTQRLYTTIGTPSSPCAYTTLPTTTISPSVTASKGGAITSCRIESLTDTHTTVGPYSYKLGGRRVHRDWLPSNEDFSYHQKTDGAIANSQHINRYVHRYQPKGSEYTADADNM